jgi:glycosyltransferase involved in cell wall biosynthesis
MTNPLVSVIIPCYNAEKYVRQAIQSALDQTYRNCEVIVIDDGSIDSSPQVIRAFGDRIRSEYGINRGACAARNRGLELSRGEFIQFLDADDVLHPNKIARQLEVLATTNADIVYCNWNSQAADASDGVVTKAPHLLDDPVVFALLKIISTPGPLYPKRLVQRVRGFREELPCAQDYDLNLRLACAGATFHHCDEVLLTVRRVPNSISSDSLRVLDQWEEIYWRAYEELKHLDQLTEQRAETFAARMAHDGRAYLQFGLVDKANSRFRDAYRMHPSGGVNGAYGRLTRILRRAFGPVTTERLALLVKRQAGARASGNV